jgi:CIC family chloride channel protein
MGLALLVGAGAGLGAIVFRYLILWFTRLFSGHDDYSATGNAVHPFFSGAANPHLPWLGIFFVIAAPAIGGLIYGPLIDRFAREARGHGVPEVMLAVAERGGRISPVVAVVKSLASALCIGSGGSVGREGPIVQIGSALGSTLGQVVRLPESRLRLLVACGAAGGISATFNAPIAGVFFGLELILRDFATESFGAVVLASVTAAIIGRAAFGAQAFLVLPAFHLVSYWECLLYAALGLLAAVVGVGFARVLYATEDLADRVWHGPEWARPAVGGLLLGLLLLVVPQLYGVGYPVLEHGIRGEYVLWFLLLLMVAKMIATSLTIAIGGSGGVFAPSLFIGAMLGTAFGDVVHGAWPALTAPAGAYGLVGMGAVFAGAARAPITAVIILFELTGDYTIILPLMAAIVLATAASSRLSRDTIYTLKLRRRGIDILRGRAANLMEVLTVADAMRPIPVALPQDLPLNELIDRFAQDDVAALPVVDEQGAYRGTVTSQEVEQAARDNALDTVAGDLAQRIPALSPGQSLEQALGILVRDERPGLPVLAAANGGIVGWLTHRDVLRAYNARLEQSLGAADQLGTVVPRVTPVLLAQEGNGAASYVGPRPATASAVSLLGRLRDYRIVDLELTPGHVSVGCRIRDISWPPSTLVVAIRRGAEVFTPNGQTELRPGDRLTVLVPSAAADHLPDLVGTVRATGEATSGTR